MAYQKQEPTLHSWSLFNLADDPEEKANVASTRQDKVNELHLRFLEQRTRDRKEHNFPDFEGPN